VIPVINAGFRECQALLKFWDANQVSSPENKERIPFWRFMELVVYDPRHDMFTLPDGHTVSVQECNNIIAADEREPGRSRPLSQP
jgi:hypothetical protein